MNTSGGQFGLLAEQDSAMSQGLATGRQTAEERASGGQTPVEPVQVSAGSQTPVEERQTTALLSKWQVLEQQSPLFVSP